MISRKRDIVLENGENLKMGTFPANTGFHRINHLKKGNVIEKVAGRKE